MLAGTSLEPSLAMIMILLCQLGGSLLVPFFIEKCGRRVLMIVSCIICSLCMVILLFLSTSISHFLLILYIACSVILNTAFCLLGRGMKIT